jgi:4-alpha-glucanotransferase
VSGRSAAVSAEKRSAGPIGFDAAHAALPELTNPLSQRRAGILLHPTSLPGPWIMGDFSHNAYRFVEFLAAAGQTVWQVLPLGPTHGDLSPYQCMSTHAGNPLLISLDWMVERGWLNGDVWQRAEPDPQWRRDTLARSCDAALASLDGATRADFDQFQQQQCYWLDDYARYSVLKNLERGAAWMDWPRNLRRCEASAVDAALAPHEASLRRCKFEQYLFYTQWLELRRYANQHGVNLFGDLPICVAGDSADVWANREWFTVDADGNSQSVAGVPPDAFTDEGQRWGNPLFNWDRLQADGFGWWLDRLRTHFRLYDLVRIDHFRGLESYWEIPASSPTAIKGKWVEAPGAALLQAIRREFGELPLVAEDLGIITAAVDKLREDFDLPGMKVLQFAFDGDQHNHHLPHNHAKDMVAYTGTHDNDTTVGWYQSLTEDERHQVRRYLNCGDDEIPWAVLRCAMMSVAQLAILPMQDVLALGADARMNTPGTVAGNWSWRFDWPQLGEHVAAELADLTRNYSRLPDEGTGDDILTN